MGKKRENGEGTFNKRQNGTWELKIMLGYDADGNQKRKSFYGKTKSECKQKAEEFFDDSKKGAAIYKNMTLGAWATEWLVTYKKDTVAPNTYRGYEYLLRHIVESFIGKMPLAEIKPIHAKKFLSLYKDFSHSQLTKFKAFLYAIFEAAIDNDLCLKNPAKNAKPPSVMQKEKEAFTDAEIATILEYAATEEGKWFELAINTLIYTGLRRGELLGLMWDDIDFENAVLNLNRAVSFGEGREVVLVTTNSRKNHTRSIPIDSVLLNLFEKEMKREGRPKSLYIFPTAAGTIYKPDNFARIYQKFLRHLTAWCEQNNKGKVRMLSMHECRHTYASLLLRRGVDSRIRQELLGHADEEMTNSYTHTDINLLKRAVGDLR